MFPMPQSKKLKRDLKRKRFARTEAWEICEIFVKRNKYMLWEKHFLETIGQTHDTVYLFRDCVFGSVVVKRFSRQSLKVIADFKELAWIWARGSHKDHLYHFLCDRPSFNEVGDCLVPFKDDFRPVCFSQDDFHLEELEQFSMRTFYPVLESQKALVGSVFNQCVMRHALSRQFPRDQIMYLPHGYMFIFPDELHVRVIHYIFEYSHVRVSHLSHDEVCAKRAMHDHFFRVVETNDRNQIGYHTAICMDVPGVLGEKLCSHFLRYVLDLSPLGGGLVSYKCKMPPSRGRLDPCNADFFENAMKEEVLKLKFPKKDRFKFPIVFGYIFRRSYFRR